MFLIKGRGRRGCRLTLCQGGEGGCKLTKGLFHIADAKEAVGHPLEKINRKRGSKGGKPGLGDRGEFVLEQGYAGGEAGRAPEGFANPGASCHGGWVVKPSSGGCKGHHSGSRGGLSGDSHCTRCPGRLQGKCGDPGKSFGRERRVPGFKASSLSICLKPVERSLGERSWERCRLVPGFLLTVKAEGIGDLTAKKTRAVQVCGNTQRSPP